MPRFPSVAVLRANSQILETMAAQLDVLAAKCERDEAEQLLNLAAQTRLLCKRYKLTADSGEVASQTADSENDHKNRVVIRMRDAS